MDVSACPLLHHLHLTDVCSAQGRIRCGKLLVCADKSDKVYIMFLFDAGQGMETSAQAVIYIQSTDKSAITSQM